jgi:hypothetical protein
MDQRVPCWAGDVLVACAKSNCNRQSRHTITTSHKRRLQGIRAIFKSVAPVAAARTGHSFLILFLIAWLAVPQTGHADDRLPKDAHADKIRVLKSKRTLELLDHDKILNKYKIALGSQPVGKKEHQGDHKTPEGLYFIDHRNEHSHFYRSFHISYPNAEDRLRAKKSGAAPGGDIMIHGLPNGYAWIGSRHRLRDWTDGCIAVTNDAIDEIWRAVADGTPIEIKP